MVVNGCSSVSFGKRTSLPSIKPGDTEFVRGLGYVPPAKKTSAAANSGKPCVGKGFFGWLHNWIAKHFLNIEV